MKNNEANFDVNNIHSVELNLDESRREGDSNF